MKIKHLLHNNQFVSLLKSLDVLSRSVNEKSIHLFRVNTKKIRAIVELVKEIDSGKNSRVMMQAPLRRLFKSSGELREIQVNRRLLNAYGCSKNRDPEYFGYLKKCEKHLLTRIKKDLSAINAATLKKRKNKMDRLWRPLKIKKVKRLTQEYVEARVHNARKLAKQSWSTKTVHRIRKELKAALPVLKIYDRQAQEPEDLKALIGIIVRLNLALGKWHDKVALVRSLRSFEKREKQDPGGIVKQGVRQRIVQDCNENLKQIRTLLPVLFERSAFFFRS
jgi:CHAD domain-containing protein